MNKKLQNLECYTLIYGVNEIGDICRRRMKLGFCYKLLIGSQLLVYLMYVVFELHCRQVVKDTSKYL